MKFARGKLLAALDFALPPNDADAERVRDYLRLLLRAIWIKGEGFSGKRPFGNSGWTRELLHPLADAGFLMATLYEDGEINEVSGGEEFVLALIDEMCAPHTKTQ